MTTKFFKITDKIFNKLYRSFESQKGFRRISSVLVITFLAMLAIVQMTRWGWFPENISKHFSTNYFFAVEVAFRLLLAIEIISMIFVLSYSVSESIAKQFEILSLILLRQAFKEFSELDNLADWEHAFEAISYMLSDSFGALIIFFGILVFKKIQAHRAITTNEEDKRRFISAKKFLSLIILVVFVGVGTYDTVLHVIDMKESNFFIMFYTLLIFFDILLVLISLRYSHLYFVVFRNSGYAVATVLLRLALTAPHYFDAALGIIAIAFVILLSLIYNKFEMKAIKYHEI